MRTQALPQPACNQLRLEYSIDGSRRKSSSPRIEKKGLRRRPRHRELKLQGRKVILQGVKRFRSDRDYTLLAAFAAHADKGLSKSHPVKIQLDEFAHTDTRRVEQFEHGPVAGLSPGTALPERGAREGIKKVK